MDFFHFGPPVFGGERRVIAQSLHFVRLIHENGLTFSFLVVSELKLLHYFFWSGGLDERRRMAGVGFGLILRTGKRAKAIRPPSVISAKMLDLLSFILFCCFSITDTVMTEPVASSLVQTQSETNSYTSFPHANN